MNHLTVRPATNISSIPRRYESTPGYEKLDADQVISFRDLLRVLRIRWRSILLLTIAVATLAMLAMPLIPPVYVGTALVMVDQQRSRVMNEQSDPSVLSNLPSDPTSIESQVQVLQSHVLAGQVVDKLNLVNDPEFNGTQSGLAALTAKVLNFVPDLIHSLTPRFISLFGF